MTYMTWGGREWCVSILQAHGCVLHVVGSRFRPTGHWIDGLLAVALAHFADLGPLYQEDNYSQAVGNKL